MTAPANTRLGSFEVTAVGGERVRAFIPPPLPPEPALRLEGLLGLLDQANRALGRLDGMTAILPDRDLFIHMYVRKEALLSSQIEGTVSTLSDLLLFENEMSPEGGLADVQEVSNYVAALNHGMARLQEGFPLSLRLIREIHAILLAKGRGSDKTPGEFRTSQNWIGGLRPGRASFVPPPPHQVLPCLGELEKFIHKEDADLPLLVKAGLVHVQFETIHPFLDGNGRLGRLLITFLLCADGALQQPILYLSLFFKANRQRYYDLLQQVRQTGDWEAWLEFFLIGVIDTAAQATATATQILALFQSDRQKVAGLGRAAASALRLYQWLQTNPVCSIQMATDGLPGLSRPTVAKAVAHLVALGILQQTAAGRQRNRYFIYRPYMDVLAAGTEPLAD